ncbi:MAG: ABC transporter permease subunit [Phycisphaeraceae bacterium]|nr:ABC transporter permease subunit [Phycisphaeraceae bacterium]
MSAGAWHREWAAALAIARRELRATLIAPIGAVVPAVFLLLSAVLYFVLAPALLGTGFRQGQPATLRLFFETSTWLLFIVAPAISMRAVSEEIRMGTLETLLTAPIHERSIIIGKFLGAFAFLVLLLAPTLLLVAAVALHGRPDFGEIGAGYLGLLLAGGAAVAVGILASTLTNSQALAFLSSIFFWVVLLLVTIGVPSAAAALSDHLAAEVASGVPAWFERLLAAAARAAASLNPVAQVRGFVVGLVDTHAVAFFLVLTAVALAMAVRSLELRRWL